VTAPLLTAAQGESLPDIFRLMAAFWVFWLCLGISLSILQVYCFCRIFSRTGHSWVYGLVAILPGGAFLLVMVLAFADWPNPTKRRKKRK
jgi:hypothetical protein